MPTVECSQWHKVRAARSCAQPGSCASVGHVQPSNRAGGGRCPCLDTRPAFEGVLPDAQLHCRVYRAWRLRFNGAFPARAVCRMGSLSESLRALCCLDTACTCEGLSRRTMEQPATLLDLPVLAQKESSRCGRERVPSYNSQQKRSPSHQCRALPCCKYSQAQLKGLCHIYAAVKVRLHHWDSLRRSPWHSA